MQAPSHDELFAALSRLRELTTERAQRQHADWRIVADWLRSVYGRGRLADDVIQETLIAITRHVHTLETDHPGGAVRWVKTIHARKLVDLLRRHGRSPISLGLARTMPFEDPIEQVPRDDSHVVDPAALELLVEAVESAIATHVDETYTNAMDRQLRRLQARAILHRALGADLDGIRAAVALGPEIGDDRIYKWIERGRPILLAALERMRVGASEASEAVIEALRELVAARRADAGLPRGPRASRSER